MTREDTDRIREWLDQGWALLAQGAPRDAADVFSRVLLLDPGDLEARRGAEKAEGLIREAIRETDERLTAAEGAVAAADTTSARVILEGVIAQGGDRDRAHALLDRIDRLEGREGRLDLPRVSPRINKRSPASGASSRAWSRHALVTVWALAFGVLLTGVASSFEGLVARLERAPTPAHFVLPPSTAVPAPGRGDQTVAAARRLLDQGDVPGAIALLQQVTPAEPAYPFARQLMSQAASQVGAPRGGR